MTLKTYLSLDDDPLSVYNLFSKDGILCYRFENQHIPKSIYKFNILLVDSTKYDLTSITLDCDSFELIKCVNS